MTLMDVIKAFLGRGQNPADEERMQQLERSSHQAAKEAQESKDEIHSWLEEIRRTEEFIRTHEREPESEPRRRGRGRS